MEKLSDEFDKSCLCIGKIPESRNNIKGFGSEMTHFIPEALKKYMNVTIFDAYEDDPKNVERHDFVMSLCPNGRGELLKTPDLFQKGNTVVLQEFLYQGEVMPQFQITFGPRGNLPAPKMWGEETLALNKQFMVYPFTSKDFTEDKTNPNKILLDAPAVRDGKRIEIPDDTEFFYDVLEGIKDELDLEIWQGGVSPETSPSFVNAIDKGFGVDDEIRVSWDEYMEHIRTSSILLLTHPESYGINKMHAMASNTQLIGRWERFPYIKEFGWRQFSDSENLKWQIKDAIRVYNEVRETLEETSNKLWSYNRLAENINDVFNDLKGEK